MNPQRQITTALITTLAAWHAVAQQAPMPEIMMEAQRPDPYAILASHLCTDLEYLTCLQITSDQCRNDLQEPGAAACGRGPYIVRDAPGLAPGAVVPSEMVECVYTAHVSLRSLDRADINRCMSAAKLAR